MSDLKSGSSELNHGLNLINGNDQVHCSGLANCQRVGEKYEDDEFDMRAVKNAGSKCVRLEGNINFTTNGTSSDDIVQVSKITQNHFNFPLSNFFPQPV